MDKQTKQAIKIAQKAMRLNKPLELSYDGLPRLVEVHAIGISSTGKHVLRVYQTSGDSVSGETPGWKLLNIGKIFDPPKIIDTVSMAPREGYQSGDKAMIEILNEL